MFLQIAKRFQGPWNSSVAEAESVLRDRLKTASSIYSSINDTFYDRCTLEREIKPLPTFPSPTSPEATHLTNGSVSSPTLSTPIKTPTKPSKPSTLKKSSGKRKTNKSSKEKGSKHSKRNSPDQSDRDNRECPYSDLDSVPKILCPKALERQPKLALTQPSATVVKEVKKQPEIQSGLWFSKSSKERRRKTTSPMPDRSLFSKVPCKKKSSVSKKTVVPGVSTNGGPSDQSEVLDKHKTVVPAEANLSLEDPGHLMCKNTVVAIRPFGTHGSLADQSVLPDKPKTLVLVETSVPPNKRRPSKRGRRDTMDTVTGMTSNQCDSLDVKNTLEPSLEVGFNDQSRASEKVKSVIHTDSPHGMSNKMVNVVDRLSDHAEEKESNRIQVSDLITDSSDALPKLEKQTSSVSKRSLSFVKLLHKDIKGKKCVNSRVTSRPISKAGFTKNEKTTVDLTKMSSKQSHCGVGKAGVSKHQAASMKVSVKKLKANSGPGILLLSSTPTESKTASTAGLGSQETERMPVLNVHCSLVDQSDSSEVKKTPATLQISMSPDQSGSSEQRDTSASNSTCNTTQSSLHQRHSAPKNAHASSGKSKKLVKYKQVSKEILLRRPTHLPASSRLMTRALKAMREEQQKKQERKKKESKPKLLNPLRKTGDVVCRSAHNSTIKLDGTKSISLKSQNNAGECDRDKPSGCSTPSLLHSDTAGIEIVVKSEDEDLSISSTPPMDFIPLTSKVVAKNDPPTDMCSPPSPSAPFSFMEAFKNVKEVSFQSLTNENNGKPMSFRPDTNYKFSTFLMILKDLHDTREREGAPLELEIGPPSAHVKEEPSVMPGETKPANQNQQNEPVSVSNSSLDKIRFTKSINSPNKISKRSYNRRGSSTGVKRKVNRKVPSRPARSGPGFPGIEFLPRVASSPLVDSPPGVQSLLDVQAGTWERPAGADGVLWEEEEDGWSRLNENLQKAVCLKQRGSDARLCLGQPNGLVADGTENSPSLIRKAGEGDASQTSKDQVV